MATKKETPAPSEPVNENPASNLPPEVEPVETREVPIEPPKKRGRKSNAEREALGLANKVTGANEKRSHKKGGGKTTYSKDAEERLAAQIVGLHQIGAMISGIPEMAIQQNEGDMLASAVMAVAAEYNLELSGKTGAAIQLLAACAAIYVPRLVMVKQRVNAQQALNNVNTSDTVN